MLTYILCQLQVATSLVYEYDVDASKVVILSPYREQRSKISKSLKKVYWCKDIPVTTIEKSQGKINFLCFHCIGIILVNASHY